MDSKQAENAPSKRSYVQQQQQQSHVLQPGDQQEKQQHNLQTENIQQSQQNQLMLESQEPDEQRSSPHVISNQHPQQQQQKSTKGLTQMEREYWQHKLPPGFQFYLERLARGVIRHQPENILHFCAAYLEELLVCRDAELWKLPIESYFVKLFRKRIGDFPWQPHRRHMSPEGEMLCPLCTETLPDVVAREHLPENTLDSEQILDLQNSKERDKRAAQDEETTADTPDMITANECLSRQKESTGPDDQSSLDAGAHTTAPSASSDDSNTSIDVADDVNLPATSVSVCGEEAPAWRSQVSHESVLEEQQATHSISRQGREVVADRDESIPDSMGNDAVDVRMVPRIVQPWGSNVSHENVLEEQRATHPFPVQGREVVADRDESIPVSTENDAADVMKVPGDDVVDVMMVPGDDVADVMKFPGNRQGVCAMAGDMSALNDEQSEVSWRADTELINKQPELNCHTGEELINELPELNCHTGEELINELPELNCYTGEELINELPELNCQTDEELINKQAGLNYHAEKELINEQLKLKCHRDEESDNEQGALNSYRDYGLDNEKPCLNSGINDVLSYEQAVLNNYRDDEIDNEHKRLNSCRDDVLGNEQGGLNSCIDQKSANVKTLLNRCRDNVLLLNESVLATESQIKRMEKEAEILLRDVTTYVLGREFTAAEILDSELPLTEILDNKSNTTYKEITSAEILGNESTTREIFEREVVTTEILGDEYKTREITEAEILDKECTRKEITTAEILGNECTTKEITSTEILGNECTTREITSTEILSNECTTTEIPEREITTTEIAGSELTSTEIDRRSQVSHESVLEEQQATHSISRQGREVVAGRDESIPVSTENDAADVMMVPGDDVVDVIMVPGDDVADVMMVPGNRQGVCAMARDMSALNDEQSEVSWRADTELINKQPELNCHTGEELINELPELNCHTGEELINHLSELNCQTDEELINKQAGLNYHAEKELINEQLKLKCHRHEESDNEQGALNSYRDYGLDNEKPCLNSGINDVLSYEQAALNNYRDDEIDNEHKRLNSCRDDVLGNEQGGLNSCIDQKSANVKTLLNRCRDNVLLLNESVLATESQIKRMEKEAEILLRDVTTYVLGREFTAAEILDSELPLTEILDNKSNTTYKEITSAEILGNESTTREIFEREVVTTEILGDEYKTREITEAEILDKECTRKEITTAEILGNECTTKEITSTEILGNECTTREITSTEILSNECTTTEIPEREITTTEIAGSELTSTEIDRRSQVSHESVLEEQQATHSISRQGREVVAGRDESIPVSTENDAADVMMVPGDDVVDVMMVPGDDVADVMMVPGNRQGVCAMARDMSALNDEQSEVSWRADTELINKQPELNCHTGEELINELPELNCHTGEELINHLSELNCQTDEELINKQAGLNHHAEKELINEQLKLKCHRNEESDNEQGALNSYRDYGLDNEKPCLNSCINDVLSYEQAALNNYRDDEIDNEHKRLNSCRDDVLGNEQGGLNSCIDQELDNVKTLLLRCRDNMLLLRDSVLVTESKMRKMGKETEIFLRDLTARKIHGGELTTCVFGREFTAAEILDSELPLPEILDNKSNTIYKEITSAEILGNESTTREIFEREVVTTEILGDEYKTREITEAEILDKECTRKEITTAEILGNECTTIEITSTEIRNNECTTREITSTEILSNECATSEIPEREITTTEIAGSEFTSTEIDRRSRVSHESALEEQQATHSISRQGREVVADRDESIPVSTENDAADVMKVPGDDVVDVMMVPGDDVADVMKFPGNRQGVCAMAGDMSALNDEQPEVRWRADTELINKQPELNCHTGEELINELPELNCQTDEELINKQAGLNYHADKELINEQLKLKCHRDEESDNEQGALNSYRDYVLDNEKPCLNSGINDVLSYEQAALNNYRDDEIDNEHKRLNSCRDDVLGNEQGGLNSCIDQESDNVKTLLNRCRDNMLLLHESVLATESQVKRFEKEAEILLRDVTTYVLGREFTAAEILDSELPLTEILDNKSNTIYKEITSAEILGNESTTREIFEREVVTTEILGDEYKTREITEAEILDKECTRKEITTAEILGNECTTRGIHERDEASIGIFGKECATTEILGREIVTIEILDNEGTTTEILGNECATTEIHGIEIITIEILDNEGTTTEILGNKCTTTEILGNECATTEILGNECATTEILGSKCATAEILGNKCTTTEILGNECATTEILGNECATTEILGSKCATAEILGNKCTTTEILGNECATTEILGNECATTEILGNECVTTEILGNECATTEILGNECATTEILRSKCATAEILGNKCTTTEILSNECATTEIPEREITTTEIAGIELTSTEIIDSELTTHTLGRKLVATEILCKEISTKELIGSHLTSTEILDSEATTTDILRQPLIAIDILGKELTTREILGSKLTTTEMFGGEIYSRELTSIDILSKELTTTEIRGSQLTPIETFDREVTTQDILRRELVSTEILSRELNTTEILGKKLTDDTDEAGKDGVVSEETLYQGHADRYLRSMSEAGREMGHMEMKQKRGTSNVSYQQQQQPDALSTLVSVNSASLQTGDQLGNSWDMRLCSNCQFSALENESANCPVADGLNMSADVRSTEQTSQHCLVVDPRQHNSHDDVLLVRDSSLSGLPAATILNPTGINAPLGEEGACLEDIGACGGKEVSPLASQTASCSCYLYSSEMKSSPPGDADNASEGHGEGGHAPTVHQTDSHNGQMVGMSLAENYTSQVTALDTPYSAHVIVEFDQNPENLKSQDRNYAMSDGIICQKSRYEMSADMPCQNRYCEISADMVSKETDNNIPGRTAPTSHLFPGKEPNKQDLLSAHCNAGCNLCSGKAICDESKHGNLARSQQSKQNIEKDVIRQLSKPVMEGPHEVRTTDTAVMITKISEKSDGSSLSETSTDNEDSDTCDPISEIQNEERSLKLELAASLKKCRDVTLRGDSVTSVVGKRIVRQNNGGSAEVQCGINRLEDGDARGEEDVERGEVDAEGEGDDTREVEDAVRGGQDHAKEEYDNTGGVEDDARREEDVTKEVEDFERGEGDDARGVENDARGEEDDSRRVEDVAQKIENNPKGVENVARRVEEDSRGEGDDAIGVFDVERGVEVVTRGEEGVARDEGDDARGKDVKYENADSKGQSLPLDQPANMSPGSAPCSHKEQDNLSCEADLPAEEKNSWKEILGSCDLTDGLTREKTESSNVWSSNSKKGGQTCVLPDNMTSQNDCRTHPGGATCVFAMDYIEGIESSVEKGSNVSEHQEMVQVVDVSPSNVKESTDDLIASNAGATMDLSHTAQFSELQHVGYIYTSQNSPTFKDSTEQHTGCLYTTEHSPTFNDSKAQHTGCLYTLEYNPTAEPMDAIQCQHKMIPDVHLEADRHAQGCYHQEGLGKVKMERALSLANAYVCELEKVVQNFENILETHVSKTRQKPIVEDSVDNSRTSHMTSDAVPPGNVHFCETGSNVDGSSVNGAETCPPAFELRVSGSFLDEVSRKVVDIYEDRADLGSCEEDSQAADVEYRTGHVVVKIQRAQSSSFDCESQIDVGTNCESVPSLSGSSAGDSALRVASVGKDVHISALRVASVGKDVHISGPGESVEGINCENRGEAIGESLNNHTNKGENNNTDKNKGFNQEVSANSMCSSKNVDNRNNSNSNNDLTCCSEYSLNKETNFSKHNSSNKNSSATNSQHNYDESNHYENANISKQQNTDIVGIPDNGSCENRLGKYAKATNCGTNMSDSHANRSCENRQEGCAEVNKCGTDMTGSQVNRSCEGRLRENTEVNGGDYCENCTGDDNTKAAWMSEARPVDKCARSHPEVIQGVYATGSISNWLFALQETRISSHRTGETLHTAGKTYHTTGTLHTSNKLHNTNNNGNIISFEFRNFSLSSQSSNIATQADIILSKKTNRHRQGCYHQKGLGKVKMERALSLANAYVCELEKVAQNIENILETHVSKTRQKPIVEDSVDNSRTSRVTSDAVPPGNVHFCETGSNVDGSSVDGAETCSPAFDRRVSGSFLDEVSRKVVDIYEDRADLGSCEEDSKAVDVEYRTGHVVVKIQRAQSSSFDCESQIDVGTNCESVPSLSGSSAGDSALRVASVGKDVHISGPGESGEGINCENRREAIGDSLNNPSNKAENNNNSDKNKGFNQHVSANSMCSSKNIDNRNNSNSNNDLTYCSENSLNKATNFSDHNNSTTNSQRNCAKSNILGNIYTRKQQNADIVGMRGNGSCENRLGKYAEATNCGTNMPGSHGNRSCENRQEGCAEVNKCGTDMTGSKGNRSCEGRLGENAEVNGDSHCDNCTGDDNIKAAWMSEARPVDKCARSHPEVTQRVDATGSISNWLFALQATRISSHRTGETLHTTGETLNSAGETLHTAGETLNSAGETLHTAGKTYHTTGTLHTSNKLHNINNNGNIISSEPRNFALSSQSSNIAITKKETDIILSKRTAGFSTYGTEEPSDLLVVDGNKVYPIPREAFKRQKSTDAIKGLGSSDAIMGGQLQTKNTEKRNTPRATGQNQKQHKSPRTGQGAAGTVKASGDLSTSQNPPRPTQATSKSRSKSTEPATKGGKPGEKQRSEKKTPGSQRANTIQLDFKRSKSVLIQGQVLEESGERAIGASEVVGEHKNKRSPRNYFQDKQKERAGKLQKKNVDGGLKSPGIITDEHLFSKIHRNSSENSPVQDKEGVIVKQVIKPHHQSQIGAKMSDLQTVDVSSSWLTRSIVLTNVSLEGAGNRATDAKENGGETKISRSSKCDFQNKKESTKTQESGKGEEALKDSESGTCLITFTCPNKCEGDKSSVADKKNDNGVEDVKSHQQLKTNNKDCELQKTRTCKLDLRRAKCILPQSDTREDSDLQATAATENGGGIKRKGSPICYLQSKKKGKLQQIHKRKQEVGLKPSASFVCGKKPPCPSPREVDKSQAPAEEKPTVFKEGILPARTGRFIPQDAKNNTPQTAPSKPSPGDTPALHLLDNTLSLKNADQDGVNAPFPNKKDFPMRIRAVGKHDTNVEYMPTVTRRLTIESPAENLLIHSSYIRPNPRQPEQTRTYEVSSQRRRFYLGEGDEFINTEGTRRLICETECFSSKDPATKHLVVENGTSSVMHATVKVVAGSVKKRKKRFASLHVPRQDSQVPTMATDLMSDSSRDTSPAWPENDNLRKVGKYIVIGKTTNMGSIQKLLRGQDERAITADDNTNKSANALHRTMAGDGQCGATQSYTRLPSYGSGNGRADHHIVNLNGRRVNINSRYNNSDNNNNNNICVFKNCIVNKNGSTEKFPRAVDCLASSNMDSWTRASIKSELVVINATSSRSPTCVDVSGLTTSINTTTSYKPTIVDVSGPTTSNNIITEITSNNITTSRSPTTADAPGLGVFVYCVGLMHESQFFLMETFVADVCTNTWPSGDAAGDMQPSQADDEHSPGLYQHNTNNNSTYTPNNYNGIDKSTSIDRSLVSELEKQKAKPQSEEENNDKVVQMMSSSECCKCDDPRLSSRAHEGRLNLETQVDVRDINATREAQTGESLYYMAREPPRRYPKEIDSGRSAFFRPEATCCTKREGGVFPSKDIGTQVGPDDICSEAEVQAGYPRDATGYLSHDINVATCEFENPEKKKIRSYECGSQVDAADINQSIKSQTDSSLALNKPFQRAPQSTSDAETSHHCQIYLSQCEMCRIQTSGTLRDAQTQVTPFDIQTTAKTQTGESMMLTAKIRPPELQKVADVVDDADLEWGHLSVRDMKPEHQSVYAGTTTSPVPGRGTMTVKPSPDVSRQQAAPKQ